MIPLKSEEELRMLRCSGGILSRVMRELEKRIKAGISTLDIDSLAEKLILEQGALPAFKGYRGYPAAVCASVNEEIVHGIPSGRLLNEGDILGLDIGVNYKGYFSDSAITIPIGSVSPKIKKLIDVTRVSLSEGIEAAIIGNCLSDISVRIQRYVED